jgi:hypothetical protein
MVIVVISARLTALPGVRDGHWNKFDGPVCGRLPPTHLLLLCCKDLFDMFCHGG